MMNKTTTANAPATNRISVTLSICFSFLFELAGLTGLKKDVAANITC
jgi:hypothetical protein